MAYILGFAVIVGIVIISTFPGSGGGGAGASVSVITPITISSIIEALDLFLEFGYLRNHINVAAALEFVSLHSEEASRRILELINIYPMLPEPYKDVFVNYLAAIKANEAITVLSESLNRHPSMNVIESQFDAAKVKILDAIDALSNQPSTPKKPFITPMYVCRTALIIVVVSVTVFSFTIY